MEPVRNGLIGVVNTIFRPINANTTVTNHVEPSTIVVETADDGPSSVGAIKPSQDEINSNATNTTATATSVRILNVPL
jgi:hypothetical protein